MSILGVTASRNGLSAVQYELAGYLLPQYDTLHHGDCKNGDATLHDLGIMLGLYVVVHPPLIHTWRAYCKGDESRPPQTYFRRNQAIVQESEVLGAFPDSTEHLHSGTWATVRMARYMAKPIVIIYPDGKLEYERWDDRIKVG